MGKTVVAALLALSAVTAYAAQWKLVEVSENKTMHFMDVSTITRNGTAVDYWEKSVYPRPHYTGDHMAYRVVKRQYLAQCPQESQVAIQQIYYDGSGHVVGQAEAPMGGAVQVNHAVVPGSYQEWMLEYACRPVTVQTK